LVQWRACVGEEKFGKTISRGREKLAKRVPDPMIGRRPSVGINSQKICPGFLASEPAQTGFASRMGTRETIVSTNFTAVSTNVIGTTCFSETGFNTRFQPMFPAKNQGCARSPDL